MNLSLLSLCSTLLALCLLVGADNLEAQINYQVSGEVEYVFGNSGDFLGLDGAMLVIDATFDDTDVWIEGVLDGVVQVLPDSATVTITGASVGSSNGVFDLQNPSYTNFDLFSEWGILCSSGIENTSFNLFAFTAEVPGIDGVSQGDPISLEQFVPATYVNFEFNYEEFGPPYVIETYDFVSASVEISAVGNLLGDLNCVGDVNLLDVSPFILAISDPEAYEADFPDCDINLADCNQDGVINLLDVSPFIDIVSGG